MRSPGVLGVLGEGSFDLWAGGLSLSILRKRHAMMGREPPIVAITRGEPLQQVEERPFLPGAAGVADQAVGERRSAEHQDIAPGIQVRRQCGKRRFGITHGKQAEKCDVADFALGQPDHEGIGRRHRHACCRCLPAFLQRVSLGGMGEGKAGVSGDGTIERLDRTGVHGQLGVTAFCIGIPRGR